MRVVRSIRARRDLKGIWNYIARESAAAADRTMDAIDGRCAQLERLPNSGMACEDISPGIRRLVCGQYLLLYRVAGDPVQIVRILHGRRNLAKAFPK